MSIRQYRSRIAIRRRKAEVAIEGESLDAILKHAREALCGTFFEPEDVDPYLGLAYFEHLIPLIDASDSCLELDHVLGMFTPDEFSHVLLKYARSDDSEMQTKARKLLHTWLDLALDNVEKH